ncbi:MAG TPA: glycosyltransferase family 4 protein [Longimicrobiales bacterium]|nr:glycosyltransferase family 4 protein [Longimicrobiales bacterium]
MKILLLSYHYPPASAVGGLRARRIAESFRQRGADVFVVAGPLEDGAIEPDDRVRRVTPSLDLRAHYLRLRGRHNGDRNAAGSADATKLEPQWTPPERTPFLKRQISSALWLPDDRQGWILPVAARATEIVRREGIDLVYSTAPPFSALLAALLVKRRTGVRWAIELRDPWTDNPSKPAFVRSAWSDAIERWLERRCLDRADHVVAVTDSVSVKLRERVAGNDDRVITVRNGIERFVPAREAARPIRRIVYVGNLYQDRDPRPFLRAVARLKAAGRLDAGLRIDFIGDCRWLLGISIERFVAEHGLESNVTFTDPIPHDACLERMRDADMLLLLAQRQPLQVPNKLYEYLGMRRPILAFADAGGETTRMLNRVGGHCTIDPDADGRVVEVAVGRALAGHTTAVTKEADTVLHEWSWDRQFDALHARVGGAS